MKNEERLADFVVEDIIEFKGKKYNAKRIPKKLAVIMLFAEKFSSKPEFQFGQHRDGHSDIGIGPLHRDTHVDYTAQR